MIDHKLTIKQQMHGISTNFQTKDQRLLDDELRFERIKNHVRRGL